MVITPVKLWCFFTLASASITLARNWVFFRRMRKCSQSALTLDSRIIDVRYQNKVYNHPPPPSPFLFFPPKPRSACRFSIWPRSTCEPVRRLGFWEQILGSLRKNDGDGYATSLKKVKSRCFKLYRAYSISFNSSNVGNFFLDLNFKKLYQSSGKEKQRRCLVFTSSKKREIWPFYIVVVQWLQRNVPKSVMHVQSCCFSKLQKPIAFFAILVDVAVVVA